MSLETIIVANYEDFAHQNRRNWLLYIGITFILIGLLLNILPKTTQNTNSSENINTSNYAQSYNNSQPLNPQSYPSNTTVNVEKHRHNPVSEEPSKNTIVEKTGNSEMNNKNTIDINNEISEPLNSNVQTTNLPPEIKDCEKNSTGNFCFYNTNTYTVEVRVYYYDQYNNAQQYTVLIIKNEETKCFYNAPANNRYEFIVFTRPAGQQDQFYLDSQRIDLGEISIEKCKSTTYTIK